MPRTPVWQWGILFNFAGRGILHNELFPLLLVSAENPTLFEAIAAYLLLYGTTAARPDAADAPLNALYYDSTEEQLFQNQNGTWVQIASLDGGGGGATLAQGTLAGRGSASGSGVYEEITVGSGLSIAGTTLSATGGVTPGLTLVENKILTADATTVTFSGLDGNTDAVYVLQGRVVNKNGSSTAGYTWRPNGLTTNQNSRHYAAAGGNTDTSTLQLAIGNTNNNWAQFIANIQAKANPNAQAFARPYNGQATYFTSAPATGLGLTGGGWNETSTNITSIEIVSSVSNGLGNGSSLALYKYAQ